MVRNTFINLCFHQNLLDFWDVKHGCLLDLIPFQIGTQDLGERQDAKSIVCFKKTVEGVVLSLNCQLFVKKGLFKSTQADGLVLHDAMKYKISF